MLIIIFDIIRVADANTQTTCSHHVLNSTYGDKSTNENIICYPQNVSDLDEYNVSNILEPVFE